MTALTWEQARAWRLRRHGLAARAPAGTMLELASRLCGVHAQLMGSAELTLWARLEGLAPEAVAQALWKERTLVKTWAMRGTLHLMPADELGLWHAGLGTYDHYLKPAWFRAFDITEARLLELIDAVGDALAGVPLTRAELAEAVAGRTGDESLREKLGQGFGAYLKPAAFRGRLCFGPGEGQRVRFTRPDVWLGHEIERPPPDEALREIARRYLAAHGPATREDLRRWWATTPAAAGRLLRSLEDAAEVRGRRRADVDARGRRPRRGCGGPRGRRPPAARVRPVRDRRHQAGRAFPPGRLPRTDLPPAGLDLARPAGGRRHGRRVAARAGRAAARRRGRAVPAPPRGPARGPRRPRPSGWRPTSAASWRSAGRPRHHAASQETRCP